MESAAREVLGAESTAGEAWKEYEPGQAETIARWESAEERFNRALAQLRATVGPGQ